MAPIELVLSMLLAVIASGFLVRLLPLSLPLPIIQILLGVLISSGFHQGVELKPEVFFLLFLPPLLFLDGWRIPKDGLLRDKGMILQLALGLVVFTVVGAGFLIHWIIPAMPLAVAFALAAIVSPTDPVAVSAIASRAPVPKRLMHILEGESLLNDASGLVCFQFAVAAALTGTFSLTDASLTFLWVAFAGLASGTLFTYTITKAQQWLALRTGEEEGSPILISILIPFGAYLLAEGIEASGILAAVAAGITMSYTERSGHHPATTRLQLTSVWNTIQFALNGIMFVLLGEQLPGIFQNALTAMGGSDILATLQLVSYALIITAILAALRYGWVRLSLTVNLLRRDTDATPQRMNNRLIFATSLAGVRGSITLAGILTLPLLLPDGSAFPARDIAIFLAAAVILISLLLASIGLPILLKDLDIPQESLSNRQEDFARNAITQAAIASIKQAQSRILEQADAEDTAVYTEAARRALVFYRPTDTAQDEQQAQLLRKTDTAERYLHLVAVAGKRQQLATLLKERSIDEEVMAKLARELDLIETRLRAGG